MKERRFETAPARRSRLVLALFAGLLLTACQGIIPGSQRDPPQLYELTPKTTHSKSLPQVSAQLVVETPVASAGLTTSRIAVKESPTTLNYFANSEWTDVAPRLVQTLLIESFEASRKIVAVGREGSGLRSDYILKVDLREFQAYTYPAPQARVNVRTNIKLVRMPAREIIAGALFETILPAKSARLNDVIEAFDDALGQNMKKIVAWTLTAIHKDKPNRRDRY